MSIDFKVEPQHTYIVTAHQDIVDFVKELPLANAPTTVHHDPDAFVTYIYGRGTLEDVEYLCRRIGLCEYKGEIVSGVITKEVSDKQEPYHALKLSAACNVHNMLNPIRGTRTNS